MKVSIIIPVYNGKKSIGRAIEACLSIDYPDKEVIVVDDGSTDGTPAIVSRYKVKLVEQENRGAAAARNAGWRKAEGDICFFTDADCLPRADIFDLLLKHFADKKVVAAGGAYEIANPQFLLSRLIHAEIVSRHISMPRYVNYIGSFNSAYRTTVLEEVNGFNEEYTAASAEDNDLSYRVLKRGGKMVFENRATVAHLHETYLWRYLVQQGNHGKWRMKLYCDHRDRARGDSYGGLFDFIQPPLALLLLLEAPLWFFPFTGPLYEKLFFLYCLLQLPMPLLVVLRTGNIENLLMIPISFLRGFARGIGMALGIVKFWM